MTTLESVPTHYIGVNYSPRIRESARRIAAGILEANPGTSAEAMPGPAIRIRRADRSDLAEIRPDHGGSLVRIITDTLVIPLETP